TNLTYSGTVTTNSARALSVFAFLPAGVYVATAQTSPTLFRLDVRFGFGPSRPGVNSPFGSRVPTNLTSSSSYVTPYSSRFHLAGTRPISRSSSVSDLPSGPFQYAIASNCWSCFGKTAPPTRANPASGTTLMRSILSNTTAASRSDAPDANRSRFPTAADESTFRRTVIESGDARTTLSTVTPGPKSTAFAAALGRFAPKIVTS